MIFYLLRLFSKFYDSLSNQVLFQLTLLYFERKKIIRRKVRSQVSQPPPLMKPLGQRISARHIPIMQIP